MKAILASRKWRLAFKIIATFFGPNQCRKVYTCMCSYRWKEGYVFMLGVDMYGKNNLYYDLLG
jgi:hypothetical protein